MDSAHLDKAVQALNEAIIIEQVPISSNADIIFKSDDFQNFKKKEEEEKMLKIELETSSDKKGKVVKIIGAKDAVMKAKSSTEEFFASRKTKKQSRAGNPPTSK